MDKDNISMLAELLRKTGDKVLQGDKTLLLNDTLLKSVNDSFEFLAEEQNCDASFLVTNTNNSNASIFYDIQFLHDFIQKVVNVSITKDTGKHARKYMLSINKFKSLRTLELTKIPVQNVVGIEQVRTQLQCVVCVHSLQQIQDLLVKCGADHSSACVWEELSEIVFTYNGLEAIDSSLIYTPFLQTIDLSHNRLKNFCVEDGLPNLKYLNLSFNLLQSVPTLGRESACKLKTLLLKNNYLKDLSGLLILKNLVELDVSCNSLADHSTLVPLRKLPLLSWLNLVGNPLSFDVKHRARTVRHLHFNAARSTFALDNRELSWKERKGVRHQSVEVTDGTEELLLSTDSTVTLPDDDIYSTPVVQVQPKKLLRPRRQKPQAKEAVITESLKEQEVIPQHVSTGDQHHLQVKHDVEQLRQRFGKEHWLSEHGATQLQAVLGLPQMTPPSFTYTNSFHSEPQASTYIERTSSQDNLENFIPPAYPKGAENVLSNVDSSHVAHVERHEELDRSEDWEQTEEEQDKMNDLQSEDEDVDERKLFTVRSASASSELLLLTVGAHNLQERDVKSGRVLQKWSIASLQSCELLSDSQPTVRLTFNVLRRDRRCRMYLVEPAEAKELMHLLGDVLASRTLSDMNQVAYRCMKCSTQFSREEDTRYTNRGNTVLCPSCGSSIVCMMEDVPLPSQVLPGQAAVPTVTTCASISLPIRPSMSSSQSSIGSKDSFPSAAPGSMKDCCLQVAAVVHQADAPSASPSRPSPPPASPMASALALTRSAISLEESCSAISTRRYDSDIEVISNPSQSSIEVIDGGIRTPGRKCSSEERQPAVVSADLNIKAISSPVITSIGLTESSSSGSFTDSICTTYETQRCATNGSLTDEQTLAFRQQNGANNWCSKKNIEKSVAEMEDDSLYGTEPVPTLQEMFEGLLEKVDKKLAISAELKSVTSVVDSSIQYSYSDFQQVDHRLRLFFLQDLLESDEELFMVVRADILKSGTTNPFPGLAVFSSAHVWVLQIIGTEGDNPESWLQENLKMPLSCVNTVFPLPWDQGVGLGCRELDRHVLLLLQDSQRTHNFLRAAESILPKACGVVHAPANYHHQFTSKVTLPCSNFGDSASQLPLVTMFNTCRVVGEKESAVKSGVIVVRTADILVTESNLSWLFPDSFDNTAIKAVAAQQISDLMEVVTDECHIGLHFVDETRHKEEVWSLVFQTPMCAQAVVVAVRTPWEQLFSVPLQVTEGNLQ